MGNGKWIWPKQAGGSTKPPFCVAEFCREYQFEKEMELVSARVTADTFFSFYINERLVGRGPHCPGGDYDGTCMFGQEAASRTYYRGVMPYTYISTFSVPISGNSLNIFADVRFGKLVSTDVSAGVGGLYMEGTVFFQDGSQAHIGTDGSWQGRIASQRPGADLLDDTLLKRPFLPVEERETVWNVRKTEIPNLAEEIVYPVNAQIIEVKPGQKKSVYLDFDTIYSGYPFLDIQAQGACRIDVDACEVPDCVKFRDTLRLSGSRHYEMLRMCAVGGFWLHIENLSDTPMSITNAGVTYVHYPVTRQGSFRCSEPLLNHIFEAGKHAVEICRQSIHLDSPAHQENLGCTGDYYVESLAEYCAFGDTALTRFDLLRTADLLRQCGGRMFHTSYSLIFLQMLWDYYRFSGDTEIFRQTEDAISLLLHRFAGYEAEELLENPPDYMFVDWLEVDGYSLHHPPKALGQTVLNAFYYKALLIASDIYGVLGDCEKSGFYTCKASRLKNAFRQKFYDEEMELYTSGSTEPVNEDVVTLWHPQNPNKKYYSVHANALAVLYGLCEQEQEKRIMERILTDDSLIQPQPYFMHFVMEAVWKSGLFERYGLPLLRRWEQALGEKPKTLKEGWTKVSAYGFDLSHAWAASPTYQLPTKLLGLTVVEPGFRRITLRPRLYGLNWAEITLPTPFGDLCCKMVRGEPPVLKIPEGIACQCQSRF